MDVVIYRPSWQKLRVSCLKDYNPYGGLLTPNGANDAVNRLFNYVSDANPNQKLPASSYVAIEMARMGLTQEEEYACRIYRVRSLLQTVINGLKSQPQYTHIWQIQEALNKLDQENSSLVVRAANKWNWDAVYTELEQMWLLERYWFTSIRKDMRERMIEKDRTGKDMMKFVGLMDQINTW